MIAPPVSQNESGPETACARNRVLPNRIPPHSILSDPGLLEISGFHVARLEALFAGEEGERVFLLQGIQQSTEEVIPHAEAWLDQALEALVGEAKRALDPDVFRPLIANYNPRGVHFVDSLFGAEVFQLPDGGWQMRCLDAPVGELERPDPENARPWRSVTAFAEAFLERAPAAVSLALPTIASALNIAVNLYGQRIIEAMMLEPEAARRDLAVINGVLCDLHRWYLRNVPLERLQCIAASGRFQPPGFGQLCGCSTQLLSADLYREFIAPLDDELLSVYPRGGMIHLCGAHAQHIPVWREMRSLRSVQTNDRASEDLARYFEGLRPDQVLYANASERMSLERILQITGGRRLVFPGETPARLRARGPRYGVLG